MKFKTLLLGAVGFCAMLVVPMVIHPSSVQAAEMLVTTSASNNWNTWNSARLVHTYPPMPKQQLNVQNGSMNAVEVTAQNVGPADLDTPLCVEQWMGGMKKHLGCVPSVHFSSAANDVSRFSYNVWPDTTMMGNSNLQFTYRDQWGNWKEITTAEGMRQNTMVNVY